MKQEIEKKQRKKTDRGRGKRNKEGAKTLHLILTLILNLTLPQTDRSPTISKKDPAGSEVK